MYYSRLLILNKILEQEQIDTLNNYFTNLIGAETKNITVSKVVRCLNVSVDIANQVLNECKKEGILIQRYIIRCPECGMVIKGSELLEEILVELECYNCENQISITAEDIEVFYSLFNDCSVDKSVFKLGQQMNNSKPKSVALEDTLKGIIDNGGLNNLLFDLTNEQYKSLDEKYAKVKNSNNNTQKGSTLEKFTIEMFNMCKIFTANEIKTTTNQLDCVVRNNLWIELGVLKIFGGIFIIECKNENKTPSGTYMSKIHSIITNFNSKEKYIKFGIIVSKKSPPKTFLKLSRDYFLSNDIIIISLCGDDIENMLSSKGNLLEIIERKISEIQLNATVDLKKAGLYSC